MKVKTIGYLEWTLTFLLYFSQFFTLFPHGVSCWHPSRSKLYPGHKFSIPSHCQIPLYSSLKFALLKWWEFETQENSHIFNHKIVAPRPYTLVIFCKCLHAHNRITYKHIWKRWPTNMVEALQFYGEMWILQSYFCSTDGKIDTRAQISSVYVLISIKTPIYFYISETRIHFRESL